MTFILLLIHSLAAEQMLCRPPASSFAGRAIYGNPQDAVFSFTANQAVLAGLKTAGAGVYGERRYLLKELGLYTLAVALPTSSGNFGLTTGYYGSPAYNEKKAGLAYGRRLGEKLDLGIQFSYYGLKAAGYDGSSAVGLEAGIIMHVTSKLNGGIHLANAAGLPLVNAAEKLPFVYSMGLGYETSENFRIDLQVEKEEDQPLNVITGLHYQVLNRLFARAGISTATFNYWIGAGTCTGSSRIDITVTYHPQLGITPGLLVVFNFLQSKKEETE